MKLRLMTLAALFAPALALAQQSAPTPAAPPPFPLTRPDPMTADECAVWNRERSFARSVEAHDAKAFAEHLHAGAVFIDGPGTEQQGPEQITKGWDGIIKGEGPLLRWYPGIAHIGGEKDIALSHGYYWVENPAAPEDKRWAIGQFSSIWVRRDGAWHVLFDGGGGGGARPSNAEEVAKLKSMLPKECPSMGALSSRPSATAASIG